MGDYWKKPEPIDDMETRIDQGVGMWSRSLALRVLVWITAILCVVALALLAVAYLSGFDTVSDMISWYRGDFSFYPA